MIPQTLTAWDTTAEATVSDADTNKKAYLEIDCVHLLNGSYTVNEYKRGNDITVGDEDEP